MPLLAVAFSLLGAAQAQASHLQGGYLTANVSADTLSGRVTHLDINGCSVGAQNSAPLTITAPGGQIYSTNLTTTATRCLTGSATYSGNYSYSLSALFGLNAVDGNYKVQYRNGNRIAGIVNLANSSAGFTNFTAQVHRTGTTPAGAPDLSSNVATGVGVGSPYSQNLNASDPDADPINPAALTYGTRLKVRDADTDAPDYDVISVSNTGQITIPSTTTSTWAAGQFYIYKVRVTDAQGDYAERDVTLRVGANNSAPVINGLNTSTPYTINSGESQTITFNATDPDAGNSVSISGAGLPSWAVLSTTPGNPAQATLTLNPPGSLTTRTYGMNFDAVDNDPTVPLTGSANIQVKVQGVPDTTILTKSVGVNTTSTSAAFTFSSNDPDATFECALDSAADVDYAPCTSPTSYAGLADGAHSFRVRGVDVDGRKDTTPATFSWTVDRVNPDSTITSSPALQSASATGSFAFSSNESGATFECSLEGGAFSICSSPKSYPGLADGSHTFAVRAVDAAGNIDPTPDQYTWTVDTVRPDTSITAQPASASASASAAFSFTATDGAGTGVDHVECSLDGVAFATCTSPVSYGSLADGSHNFSVRAVDAAGNIDATPATYSWTVDTLAPTTTIATKPARYSNSVDAGFTFTASETATFAYSLDGGATWTAATSPLTLPGLPDGDYAFLVRAIDAVGNVGTPDSYTFTVDTTNPARPDVGAPNPMDTAPALDFTGEGNATFECSLDAVAFAACTSPYQVTGPLAEGDHTFRVRQTDRAGNVSPIGSRTWTVDTIAADAPTVTSAPAAISATSHFEFNGEPGAVLECSIDGGAYAPCSSPLDVTGLADGDHVLQIRQTDGAGNVSAIAERTWMLDTHAPDGVAVLSGPTAQTTSTSASFVLAGEPGASIECRMDGGAWVACASPVNYTGLALGKHSFEVRQTDAAGNVSVVRTAAFEVVKEAPPAPAAERRLTAVLSSSVSLRETTAIVGCRLTGAQIRACTVNVYVRGSVLGASGEGAGKLVLIGTGRTTTRAATGTVAVKVGLNRTGRRYIARLGGAQATFKLTATPSTGAVMHATKTARIVPAATVVVPASSLFSLDSAKVSARGQGLLRGVARQIGSAGTVTCIGHTDSLGSSTYNVALGKRRATAVCHYLAAHGVKGARVVRSAGETRPRASNATARGRALNRRVELNVRYR